MQFTKVLRPEIIPATKKKKIIIKQNPDCTREKLHLFSVDYSLLLSCTTELVKSAFPSTGSLVVLGGTGA